MKVRPFLFGKKTPFYVQFPNSAKLFIFRKEIDKKPASQAISTAYVVAENLLNS
jgi:hypothetical protein